MRIAALFDIHGNLPALEAVLADVAREQVSLLVVGGDVVPGPMPAQCLEAIRSAGVAVQWIHGNGELDVSAAAAGEDLSHVNEAFRETVLWCSTALSAEDRAFMRSWPRTVTVEHPTHGRMMFCHATPRSAREIFTVQTPVERLRPVVDAGAEVVVCGHTHMPFDRLVGTTRVVNAGSVGLPFGHQGAAWLLSGETISARRTAYDVTAAVDRMRNTGAPGMDFIATTLHSPPPAEQVIARYEQVALRP